jgi:hypothetical protein
MAGEEGATPTPGTPEHDAAMAAKAEAVFNPPTEEVTPPAAEAPATERPQWLPEKFGSPEELAKAYAELEQKQGKAPEQTAEEPPKEEGEQTEAEKIVEAAGLDYASLNQEFNDKGTLSEESYKALEEKAGLTREMVDTHIAGQQALAREAQTRAFDIAGGADQYDNMTKWAAANLDIKEIEAYNQAIEGSAEQAALAVAGLKSKYITANGSEPSLLTGGNGGGQEVGFQSTSEMTTAMKDPRYAKDPAYRKSVERRIAVSNIF